MGWLEWTNDVPDADPGKGGGTGKKGKGKKGKKGKGGFVPGDSIPEGGGVYAYANKKKIDPATGKPAWDSSPLKRSCPPGYVSPRFEIEFRESLAAGKPLPLPNRYEDITARHKQEEFNAMQYRTRFNSKFVDHPELAASSATF